VLRLSAAFLALLLALLLVVLVPAAPRALEPEPEIVRREVLAIYDSRVEPDSGSTVIHLRLEAVFDHLGYVLDYRDVNGPLPDAAALDRYAAVVTWFVDDLEAADAFLGWAADAARAGTRFIAIGHLGVTSSPQNRERLNVMLAGAGVEYLYEHVEVPFGSRIVHSDPSVVGFERALDRVLTSYPIIRATGPDTRPALVVRAPALEGGHESVLVATGPAGGHVAGGFEIHFDPELNLMKWIIDPFTFLARALGEPRFPVPDTTTVSGRRLYFSHVDGDGWLNLSEMEEHREHPATAAEVMLRELIEPYPDLPVTVGLVSCDVDPVEGGLEAAADVARAIYALPQVEVASHTHTHPFDWGFYERYDRAAEERMMAGPAGGPRRPEAGLLERMRDAVGLGRAEAGSAQPYVSGSNDLPRAYLRHPFDLGAEIGGALAATSALAPPGKPAALYLWSGDTRPFEAAVAATRAAGVRNMNGGDGRFDARFPSIGYVAPIGRAVGAQRQIYAVASNENTYTDLWTAHFHGFAQLEETLRRTEEPRRLKGANVYYHTYSAEKRVSLEAVRTHLDWARDAPLAPIEASRYAAIADGFYTTRIERLGPGRWRVSQRDGLQTVRFDDADGLRVDLSASEGVLGSNRHGGALYVALDESVPAAVVAIAERGAATPTADLAAASLVESRWLVRGLARAPEALRFEARGYGSGYFRFAGLPPAPYVVSAQRDGRTLWRATVRADADGEIAFAAPFGGLDPASFEVARAGAGEGDEP